MLVQCCSTIISSTYSTLWCANDNGQVTYITIFIKILTTHNLISNYSVDLITNLSRNSVRENANKISKYIPICDRNSPEVNDCLIEAVSKGLVAMAKGIKDLGVPAIDPYHQKELKLDYNNNQISAKMSISNIYVSGVSGSTVKDVRLRAEDDSFHMEIDMFSPQIFCRGHYSGGGSYNALRLNATGDFNTSMSDLTYTWKLDGTPENIDGQTYVRINSFYMRPDVGNMVTHMTNENPDSKELTDLAVRLTNQNWRLLYRELLPLAQSNWNKTGIRIANKIFLKVPYEQLFPVKS